MWCMFVRDVPGTIQAWWLEQSDPRYTGVSHDNKWTVLTSIPDIELVEGEDYEVFTPATDMPEQELGSLMAALADTGKAIFSDNVTLGRCYRTPVYRLWCAQYEAEDDPQFVADKEAVGLDAGLSIDDAKAAIHGMVTQ